MTLTRSSVSHSYVLLAALRSYADPLGPQGATEKEISKHFKKAARKLSVSLELFLHRS